MEKMEKPMAPCKDCKSRTEDCHGRCRIYQAFEKAHKKWKEEFRDGRDEYMMYRNKRRKTQR